MSPLPSKVERAGVCAGHLQGSDKLCGSEREAQAAGRYLQHHMVPFLCFNPECSEYLKPYARTGEPLSWENIERQKQIEGVSP